jgi:hypothetical protein
MGSISKHLEEEIVLDILECVVSDSKDDSDNAKMTMQLLTLLLMKRIARWS